MIDVIDIDNTINNDQYTIYEDLPNGKGFTHQFPYNNDESIRCSRCRLNTNVGPYILKVKLI